MKSSLTWIMMGIMFSIFAPSCALINTVTGPDKPAEPQKAQYVNPYPSGTHDHFTHRLDYKKTYEIFKDEVGYNTASPSSTSITLNLSTLRGQLSSGGKVVLDYPIAPGRAKYPTPTGDFRITEKIVDKESNLYGKIYDENGGLVNGDADSRKDVVPPGGRFDGADMPYWMRLTGTGIGMHQGRVPRYAASHGCIRHTWDGVKQVYAKTKIGTPVKIVE